MPRKKHGLNRKLVMEAGDDICHLTVFERDNWICGICGDPVDKYLRQPSWWCATLDHVTPISVAVAEGWALETIHTYENVQLAHNRCNALKDNRLDASVPRVV